MQLEVGKSYSNAHGNVIRITSRAVNPSDPMAFYSSDSKWWYHENGQAFVNVDDPRNLICEAESMYGTAKAL